MQMPTQTSLAARLRQLADEQPNAPALTCAGVTLSRRDVERAADALARDLSARGVDVGAYVAIALPNGLQHPIATVAAWKLGAVPLPLSPKLSPRELIEIFDVARPAVVVGVTDPAIVGAIPCLPAGYEPPTVPDGAEPLPDRVSPTWKAPTSGGSTGRPKIIRAGQPGIYELVSGFVAMARIGPGATTLVTVPFSHNTGFTVTMTMLVGGHAVITPRFDAEELLRLIEAHRVSWLIAVPTMMTRIAKLSDDVRTRYDVSSLETVFHGAAPCPPETKDFWIKWLGPERVLELFAAAEFQAATLIDGSEWLAHRGSVGRPIFGEIEIRDDDGLALPPGQVGRVWMRPPAAAGTTYEYVGAAARRDDDGWETVGDMGRFDDEGYLYLADRDSDMILVGGANVFPAEVEAVLVEHPAVLDACVIGLPDDDLGAVPHALIHAESPVDPTALDAFVAARLMPYKRPRSYEVGTAPLRDGAGKVRRAALVAARTSRRDEDTS